MRLNKYLIERFEVSDQQLEKSYEDLNGKVGAVIKQQCKPFLSQVKSQNLPGLFRGIRHASELIGQHKVRTDRRPLDSSVDDSEAIDDAFERKFGWRPRSQALMCSGRPGQAGGYGDLFLVLPIGKFKFIWSRTIADLFPHIDVARNRANLQTYKVYGDPDSELNVFRRKLTDDIVADYQETDLKQATVYGAGEIMVGTKMFWAIDYRSAMWYVAEKEEREFFELIDRHKNNRDMYKAFYRLFLT